MIVTDAAELGCVELGVGVALDVLGVGVAVVGVAVDGLGVGVDVVGVAEGVVVGAAPGQTTVEPTFALVSSQLAAVPWPDSTDPPVGIAIPL